MSQINDLASNIVSANFDYLTGTDRTCMLSSVESWLLYNLGKLNNRIYTSFSGENPNLGLEEQSIYSNMFLQRYYSQEAQKVLRNMSSDTLQWLSLREGDSSITLHNKNEVAKTYMSFSRDAGEALEKEIASYNNYLSTPREVSTTNVYYTGDC